MLKLIAIVLPLVWGSNVVATEAKATDPKATKSPIAAEKDLKDSIRFFEENKTKPGVVALATGLQYKILKEGNGNPPNVNSFVQIHYRGTLLNGTEFGHSDRKNPAPIYQVSAVIPGWSEALQLMKPGAKWIVYIPPNLAYGEKDIPGEVGPNDALIYEIELIAVVPTPQDETGVLEDLEE